MDLHERDKNLLIPVILLTTSIKLTKDVIEI